MGRSKKGGRGKDSHQSRDSTSKTFSLKVSDLIRLGEKGGAKMYKKVSINGRPIRTNMGKGGVVAC